MPTSAISSRPIALSAADLVIRAGRIYTMSTGQPFQRVLAIRDGAILAMSDAPEGLDALISSTTHVVDEPSLTILPAFNDTHNHLLEATRNAAFAPVNRAHTIAEFVAIVRERDRTNCRSSARSRPAASRTSSPFAWIR